MLVLGRISKFGGVVCTAFVTFMIWDWCRCDSAVLSGVNLMLFSCVVWLKLVSYAHTNYDLRVLAKSIDKVMKWEISFLVLASYMNFPLKLVVPVLNQ